MKIAGITQELASGLDYSRGGLLGVIEAAKNKQMEKLLIVNISHLRRDTVKTMELEPMLEGFGVQVESLTEGAIDSSLHNKYIE